MLPSTSARGGGIKSAEMGLGVWPRSEHGARPGHTQLPPVPAGRPTLQAILWLPAGRVLSAIWPDPDPDRGSSLLERLENHGQNQAAVCRNAGQLVARLASAFLVVAIVLKLALGAAALLVAKRAAVLEALRRPPILVRPANDAASAIRAQAQTA